MKTLITIIAALFFMSCNSSDDDDGLFLVKEQAKKDSLAKVDSMKSVIVKK